MLTIRKISKTFNPGTTDAKKALDDLSFHAEKGDFVTIIGANGAGKSTLFNAIAGSFITDSGEILLDGEDISLMPEFKRAKKIGRLFQDPMRGSAPGMTIEENLALAAGKGGWLHRLTKQEKKQLRERVALLGMGLEDRMSQPVGLLSGGQRQALTLMMATYNPPKLLLTVEDGSVAHEFVPFSARQLHRVPVDITGLTQNAQIAQRMKEQSLGLSPEDMVEFLLTGESDPTADISAPYLQQTLQGSFFFVKVKDESHLALDADAYRNDVSLKGEFIRQVLASELTDADKAAVIRAGLQALSGEEISL